MTIQGYIPQELVIYSRAPDTWHLDAMYDMAGYNTPTGAPDGTVETVKGRKGFPVDKAKDKGTTGTASRWADAKPVTARSRIALLFDDVADAYETVPNDPRKNLRVFYLEERGEGGRAYKVIDEEGYVWDMREDVFLEALMTQGIRPGGYLNGEFIFGIKGSQIRLVRVGSHLHSLLDDGSRRKTLAPIPDKDLVVGKLYQNKAGKTGMFCGWVCSHNAPKKAGLWYQFYSWDKTCKLPGDWMARPHSFSVVAKHGYVTALAEPPAVVPANLVMEVRSRYATSHTNYLNQMAEQARIQRWGTSSFIPQDYVQRHVNVPMATMIPFENAGQPNPIHPELAPYLTRSSS